MFRYLRVRGPLPAGAIITVEPGVSIVLYTFEAFLTKYCRFTSADSSSSHTSQILFMLHISTLMF